MPFDTECLECGRGFKLKDELLGKKFKCIDCGAVVVAESILPAIPVAQPVTPRKKATRSASGSASGSAPSRQNESRPPKKKSSSRSPASRPSSSRPSSSRPAPAKKKRRPKPAVDEYSDDAYGDYSDDFDDFGDAGAYDDPYGSVLPRKSSKKPTKGKAKKRKKSQSGFRIGFNFNRINAAMMIVAVIIGANGIREARMASKSKAEPSRMTVSDLMADRSPDNIHLTVTDAKADVDEYVYEYRGQDENSYTKVYIPCRSRSAGGQRVALVLMSTELNSHSVVQPLGSRQEFTGMIVNEIRSLEKDELKYLQGIPGVNTSSVLLFELGRKPASTGFIVISLLGAAILLAAALFWVFFTTA